MSLPSRPPPLHILRKMESGGLGIEPPDVANILDGALSKIVAHLEITPDAASTKYNSFYAQKGSGSGSLRTWSGPLVNHMVRAWLTNPVFNFSSHSLLVWLDSSVRVPHLVLELGTTPDLFVYFDFIPRSDLTVDLDALDRYYAPLNERTCAVYRHPEFRPFFSQNTYMRQVMSPCSLCFQCKRDERNLSHVHDLADQLVTRWLNWVDAAEPVPEEERPALARRDRAVRRAVAERDPGVQVARHLYGDTMASDLVAMVGGFHPELGR